MRQGRTGRRKKSFPTQPDKTSPGLGVTQLVFSWGFLGESRAFGARLPQEIWGGAILPLLASPELRNTYGYQAQERNGHVIHQNA